MYFSALMDSVTLHLLLLLLLHCLHCTVIQLFGYLHSRKCASEINSFIKRCVFSVRHIVSALLGKGALPERKLIR